MRSSPVIPRPPAARPQGLFRAVVIVLAFVAAVGFLGAEGLSVQGHLSIAPSSIPVKAAAAATGIGMTRLQFRNGSSGDLTSTSISSITLALTKSAGLAESSITAVRVYFEAQSQSESGEFDHGSGTGGDVRVDAGGTYTFTAGTVTIPINPALNTIPWGASSYLYVVFDFAANPGSGETVGCEITSVTYGVAGTGTGGTGSPKAVTAHGVQRPLDDYEVSLAASGLAGVSRDQGTQKVPLLKLDFDLADASVTADIDSIRLHRTGGADTDVFPGGVLLYEDADLSGTFDPDIDTLATAGTLSGGYVTLNPTSNLQFTSAGRTYFVAVNLATNAGVGNVLSMNIENPAVDVVFKDEVSDDDVNILSEYAYVNLGYPYTQKGYIVSTSAAPTTNNTITITAYIPFAVVSISPANTAVDVLRTSNITFEFGRQIEETTLTHDTGSGGSFSLTGAVSGLVTGGSLAYDGGTKTATFDPAANLSYGETYTARVTTAVTDTLGNPLEAQRTWSFTVETAVNPRVSATNPVNGDVEIPRAANVTATFSKAMNPATITVSTFTLVGATSGAVDGAVSYDAGTNTATFNPTSDLPMEDTFTATIVSGAGGVKDLDGLSLGTDKTWTFDTVIKVNPRVLNTSPMDMESGILVGANVQAVFSEPVSGVGAATFTLARTATPLVAVPAAVSYAGGSNTATLDPASDLEWNTSYTATLTTAITDSDGLPMLLAKSWTFTTVIPIPPTVVYTSPSSGEEGAAVGGVVQAVFSEPVSGIDGTSFTLTGRLGVVGGAVSYDPGTRTATFDPAVDLEYYNPLTPGSGQYTATITTAVVDGDGLHMTADRTWSFRTSELKVPKVVSTTPADGATGAPVGAAVQVVFSEAVTGVDGTSFTLRDDLTLLPVGGTVDAAGDGITFSFTPDAPLIYGRRYTATITGASVLDSDSLPMAANEAWSFTTFGAFAEPTVTNNLVRPGSSDPVRIFIPEPPKGAQDRVTVQVFTATGKRVATLVSGRRYQDILAELPIVWDTANGRGQRLGPGVYYIQIRATDYRKVLKVMIVR